MQMKMREDGQGWEEMPMKGVGRKGASRGGLREAAGFLQLVTALFQPAKRWSKGVYRFKTFEEADQWWINQMKS